jgi:hypothetical protein
MPDGADGLFGLKKVQKAHALKVRSEEVEPELWLRCPRRTSRLGWAGTFRAKPALEL